jgi:DNA (cytosine-5)-methyltransferase 1
MMASFYNEIDPYAAAWLRNLIKAGLIPDSEVSTQSIVDLRPSDLSGFDQCHFFAGIGGWSQALHLAGWAPDRPVWTGSCPCQPFSVAGKGAGIDDARHLWPHFHRLIAACRPPVVMGEQVAGKAGYGWFDGVRADLEATGYAGRAVDIPALAVNAPHIRQRLYWVACDMADNKNIAGFCVSDNGTNTATVEGKRLQRKFGRGDGNECHMADTDEVGWGRRARDGDGERDGQAGGRVEDHGQPAGGSEDRLDVADLHQGGQLEPIDAGERPEGVGSPQPSRDSGSDHMADADNQRCGEERGAEEGSWIGGRRSYPSFWSGHIWLTGSDGKARRSKPGLPLLAHGVSNRVGRLRAYGNAIVPPLAAEVVKALMETLDAH